MVPTRNVQRDSARTLRGPERLSHAAFASKKFLNSSQVTMHAQRCSSQASELWTHAFILFMICLLLPSLKEFFHLVIRSFVNALIPSFISSFIHSLVHSFIHFMHSFFHFISCHFISFIHAFFHAQVHSFFHSFLPPFIPSFLHLFIEAFFG